MHIAFLGLGAMGAPMAANIARHDVQLTVYNRDPDKARQLELPEGTVADSVASAVAAADVVCTCLADPAALEAVLLGDAGAIAAARGGTLFIDFSTVDPATSQAAAAACAAAGCGFVEAPVSGGVPGARAGSLTIIAGADAVDYERALPVLRMVGKQVTHVGPVGAGSAIKLINQMLVGVNLAAVLEAFVLGRRAGIDPQVLYDIVRQSSGNSGMLNRAVPGNLMARQFEPGFSMRLLLKDLTLVQALADSLEMTLELTPAARTLYEEGVAQGLERLDMTAAVLPMEQRYGVELTSAEGSGNDD